MGRRIEIELTSKRDDGTWTWRAPGAREPRGVVEGELLPPDSTPGNVLRAEADFELEGIFVTSIIGSKASDHKGREGERIEIIGTSTPKSTVSVSLVPGGDKRRRSNMFDDRPAPKRRSGPRGDRPAGDRPRGDRPAGDRPAGEDDGKSRAHRSERRPDGGQDEATRRPPRERTEQSPAAREPRPDGARRPDGPRTSRNGAQRPGQDRGRPRTLAASTVFRNAALATLKPEQLPVAEQLLRGGIPALRRAIDEQNTRARSEGRSEVDPEQLLAMADELLPKMNLASWKDRAVAARTADREFPLRELRAVVAAASTVILDDESRELQTALRKSLDTRVTALRESWLERIGRALDEQRVVDALQTATRSPEPSMRLPAELAVRLSDSAGAALRSDLDDETWLRILQAVVASPIKRTVKPEGIPPNGSDEVLAAARSAAGSVPQLARLLGLPIPPPPGPRRPPRQLGPARRSAPA